MLTDLKSTMEWARREYPHCSLKVKAQPDGPTIVTIKCPNEPTRVAYVKQGDERR